MKNEALYKSFDNIPTRRGRGGTYSYVRWQDVADRMNEVFGTLWSSETMFQDVIEKNVIVRVRVTVFDKDTGVFTKQEGFGGAPLDAASEAGNPFKAAYSKALKDACKKWGVALYLEEDGDEGGHMTPSPLPPGYSGKEYGVPSATPAKMPEAPAVMSAPVPPTPSTPAQPMPPVSNGMAMPPGVAMSAPGQMVQETIVVKQEAPKMPPVPTAPSVSHSIPPFPTGPSASKTPMSTPATPMSPPTSKVGTINTGEPEKISDVQKAALHSILSLKGVDYKTLAKEAFELNGVVKNPIPEADDLTYQEAVYVVKYGNDQYRKR